MPVPADATNRDRQATTIAGDGRLSSLRIFRPLSLDCVESYKWYRCCQSLEKCGGAVSPGGPAVSSWHDLVRAAKIRACASSPAIEKGPRSSLPKGAQPGPRATACARLPSG